MANPFEDAASDLLGGIFGSILTFSLVGIVIGVVMGVGFYYLWWKRKFDIFVEIRSDRSQDPSIYFDKAAILYDRKDKNKYLRLLDTKIDLPVPSFKILSKTNKGDHLKIWRKSEDEFIYLTPGKIDKDRVVRSNGKLIRIAEINQKQVEGDIAYWNVKRKDKNKKLFDTESLLLKFLPYFPLLMGGTFMIFLLYIMFDSLPGLINQLTELTKALNDLQTGRTSTTPGIAWILLKSLG